MNIDFKSLRKLSNAILVIACIFVILYAIGIYFDVKLLNMIESINKGVYVSEEQAASVDSIQATIGIIQAICSILFMVSFFRWVYRANKNLYSLGKLNKNFSPGWAVGWFFVPIAGLYKPYQALKEIFIYSHPDNHNNYESTPDYKIINVWWFLWIVQLIVSSTYTQMSIRSETIPELLLYSKIQIVSDITDIIVSLFTVIIVLKITDYQQEKIDNMQTDSIQITQSEENIDSQD